MKTKNELLETLRADKNIGLAYGQSGVILRAMDFREFLDWYSDCGNDMDIEEEERYNEETDEDITVHVLTTRSRHDSRKVYNTEVFDTEADATDAYYSVLEGRYQDDNGAGGVFYENETAIDDLEAGKYDEYFQAEETENA